jgi:hypothetical protein
MYYGQVFSLRKMYLQFSQNLVFRRDCHFFLFLFFPGRRIASLLVKYLSLCCLLHMRMNLCHNSNGYLYSWKGKFTITKSLSNSASPPPPSGNLLWCRYNILFSSRTSRRTVYIIRKRNKNTNRTHTCIEPPEVDIVVFHR